MKNFGWGLIFYFLLCSSGICADKAVSVSSGKIQKVSLATDKVRYGLGEKVSATIKNFSDTPVWFYGDCGVPLVLLEKKKDKWKEYGAYPTKDCYAPPFKIDPQKERTFSIDLQNVYFSGLGQGHDKLRPGIYKFRVWYTEADLTLVGQGVKGEEIYSNEFTISLWR